MEYLKEMITKDIEKLNNLYHCAIKKIQHYNEETGKSEKPSKNNGYKMELFFNGFIPFLAPEKFGTTPSAKTRSTPHSTARPTSSAR